MRPTVEEVTKLAMELGDEERLQVAEALVSSVQPDEAWRQAWAAEVERREQRLENGEERELTIEEFWSDED